MEKTVASAAVFSIPILKTGLSLTSIILWLIRKRILIILTHGLRE